MNIPAIYRQFPTQEACISHLEKARWADEPTCPFCGSDRVARKRENDRVGRWNCHSCHNSYNVLTGTIFKGTRVDLQLWFLAIAILLNAKKSVSSLQLGRDLGINPRTAYRMGMQIRKAMVDDSVFLHGIVEADETYIGGKPRKSDRNDDDPPKPGRGTKKQPVLGAVARGGKVVARPSDKVNGKTLKAFLSRFVDGADSVLVTDEFSGYNRMDEWVPHMTINHAVAYAQGLVHTQTIEGFWSLVKRAIFGQHHHYSKAHAAAYIVEACYKYNNRNNPDAFSQFLNNAVKV